MHHFLSRCAFFVLHSPLKKAKNGLVEIYRVISSAVEHLVYTEAVGGSIPSSPTILILLSLTLLSACGKKGDLVGENNYPHEYPRM